ncbi:hypothetical protein ANCCEY_09598 [Ancylostoma ceylanicum]|uniref:Uncharacterized protein n=1 Tax=Ancylostoma ceylanicum TaxID=53326 RepID=A0A0D6LGY3_9BILA|nr:hypothetical protein ANCCEY_09598 [Ancylostoma ceylanicum]
MYGAGEAHASKTLAQAGMDSKRAAQTARDLFKMTKGTESSWKKLRREVQPLLRAFVDERDDLPDYLTVDGNFYIPNYDNKLSESATFNFLEMQTHRDVLRTPVLDCRLSDSLSALPEGTPDRDQFAAKYKRSVMNWVRYLCSEDDAPRLGLALMLSNMYVRSFISCKMGIEQLPLSVAFFSQVDCDKVLRKEVNTPCFAADGTPLPNGLFQSFCWFNSTL